MSSRWRWSVLAGALSITWLGLHSPPAEAEGERLTVVVRSGGAPVASATVLLSYRRSHRFCHYMDRVPWVASTKWSTSPPVDPYRDRDGEQVEATVTGGGVGWATGARHEDIVLSGKTNDRGEASFELAPEATRSLGSAITITVAKAGLAHAHKG